MTDHVRIALDALERMRKVLAKWQTKTSQEKETDMSNDQQREILEKDNEYFTKEDLTWFKKPLNDGSTPIGPRAITRPIGKRTK